MDNTSAPLADYFWIAGIDSLSYDPLFQPSHTRSQSSAGANPGQPSPDINTTIEEGSEGESPPKETSNGTPRATARHSRNNSMNQLGNKRNSIQGLDDIDTTRSNRSSMTIKAPTTATNGNGTGNGNSNGNGNRSSALGDFDFDRALFKFANERETFLDDLSFSAGVSQGAPLQRPPPPPVSNPRTERLRHEDENAPNGRRSPLRSVGGSIRRKISFRDMNSMKRQPTTVQRSSKWNYRLGDVGGIFVWRLGLRRILRCSREAMLTRFF